MLSAASAPMIFVSQLISAGAGSEHLIIAEMLARDGRVG
jgi:hypothetical protein